MRAGAKNIMTGLDSDASACHQQLLSVLDESERYLAQAFKIV